MPKRKRERERKNFVFFLLCPKKGSRLGAQAMEFRCNRDEVRALRLWVGRRFGFSARQKVLRALAKVCGSEAGFFWAEAFTLIREFL